MMARITLLLAILIVAACQGGASASPSASAAPSASLEQPSASPLPAETTAPSEPASSSGVDDPGTKIELAGTFGGSTSTTTITTTDVACTREAGQDASLRVTYSSATPGSTIDELSILIPDTAQVSTGTTEFSAKGSLGGTGGVPFDMNQGDLTSITAQDDGSSATVTAEASAGQDASVMMTISCLKIG
jgi:hypothetical protein